MATIDELILIAEEAKTADDLRIAIKNAEADAFMTATIVRLRAEEALVKAPLLSAIAELETAVAEAVSQNKIDEIDSELLMRYDALKESIK